MSKIKFYFSTLLLLVLCFSSCTTEKKFYSSGYHVDWNNSNRILVKKELINDSSRDHTELNKLASFEQSEIESYFVNNSTTKFDQNVIASVDNESVILAKKELINLATIQQREENKQEVTINSSIKSDIKTITKNPDEEPKTNTLALISFISAILSLVVYVGIIPSLLLGAIALRQFKRNPEKYKNKWMAKVGVLVGYIGCSLGILASLALAMFGGPIWLILGGLCAINIIVSTVIILRN